MPTFDTLEEKELAERKAAEQAARTQAALAALERLRKLTENLPPVDAVAIIREMRDAASTRFE
jgi:hypothetical protein